MTRRFGSLFAGVGGFDVGLERAGWECAWQVELDPFCRRVLARHWPGVPRFTDIREVRGAELPPVDLICGGWPCQDVSVAGKRAGLSGARSGLFHEMTRIVKEMRDATGNVHPTLVMGENVPGLLSSNGGRDFAAVLHGLAQCGCVEVQWRLLDSRFFNVPQRRRRVFLIGHLGAPCPAEVLVEPEGVRGDLAPGGEAGAEFTDGTGDGVAYSLRPPSRGATWKGDGRENMIADVSYALTAPGGKGGDPSMESYVHAFAWQQGDDSPHTGTGRGRSWVARAGDYTGALSTTRHDAVAFNHLQDPVSDPSVGTTLGEEGQAVMEPAALYYSHDYNQDRVYDPEGIAPAVTAQDSSGARQELTGAAVRRLTPTECERLQGFEDGHTCLCGVQPYSTAACKCPDGPRYASLGNAVTVPVIHWLAERLRRVHEGRVDA